MFFTPRVLPMHGEDPGYEDNQTPVQTETYNLYQKKRNSLPSVDCEAVMKPSTPSAFTWMHPPSPVQSVLHSANVAQYVLMESKCTHVIYLDTQCTVHRRDLHAFFFPLAACCLSYVVMHKQLWTLHISNQEHLMTLLTSIGCTTTFNVVVCNAVALLYTVSPTYILYLLSMIISSLKTRLCTYVRLLHPNYGNVQCLLSGRSQHFCACWLCNQGNWLGGGQMCNLIL